MSNLTDNTFRQIDDKFRRLRDNSQFWNVRRNFFRQTENIKVWRSEPDPIKVHKYYRKIILIQIKLYHIKTINYKVRRLYNLYCEYNLYSYVV